MANMGGSPKTDIRYPHIEASRSDQGYCRQIKVVVSFFFLEMRALPINDVRRSEKGDE